MNRDQIDFNDLSCLRKLIEMAVDKRDKSKPLDQWFLFNGIVIKLKRQYREVYRDQLYKSELEILNKGETYV